MLHTVWYRWVQVKRWMMKMAAAHLTLVKILIHLYDR